MSEKIKGLYQLSEQILVLNSKLQLKLVRKNIEGVERTCLDLNAGTKGDPYIYENDSGDLIADERYGTVTRIFSVTDVLDHIDYSKYGKEYINSEWEIILKAEILPLRVDTHCIMVDSLFDDIREMINSGWCPVISFQEMKEIGQVIHLYDDGNDNYHIVVKFNKTTIKPFGGTHEAVLYTTDSGSIKYIEIQELNI